MKKAKKIKLLTVIAALLVMAMAIAGGSVAYFTDAKDITGVFVAGNVYIELSEAAVKKDATGNLVEDAESDRIVGGDIDGTDVIRDFGKVFPGQTIHKDPTIENTGDDSAWVAAKIILTDGAGDIHKLFGYEGYDDIDIESFLSGGLLGESVRVGEWNGISDVCYNERYAMVQSASRERGVYEFYFFMLKSLESGESVEIFDTMTIDPFLDNSDMRELCEFQISVQAFAVQEFGFSSCYDAMQGAFLEHFTSCVSLASQ